MADASVHVHQEAQAQRMMGLLCFAFAGVGVKTQQPWTPAPRLKALCELNLSHSKTVVRSMKGYPLLSPLKAIYGDTRGDIDYFIAGVGTGGTISGVGKYLKEKDKTIKVVAVEPRSSAVLSGGQSGMHKIQGIGAGFVPDTLDMSVVDEIYAVSDEDAYMTTKALMEIEGIFAGISSGAALHTAISIAREVADKQIVVILPDSGDRYLSLGLYD